MNEFTIVLGIAAAVLHGSAFILYSLQAKIGTSSPNAASWSIWAFLAIINAFSYYTMSGDAIATLQFFTGSVACLLTFFYVLAIGKFSRLRPTEWGFFALGLLAVLVWLVLRSATSANIIILVATLISCLPTLAGVRRNPLTERPLPWVLWTIAMLLTATNVVLRGDAPIALLTPLALAITYSSIAIFSTKKLGTRLAR